MDVQTFRLCPSVLSDRFTSTTRRDRYLQTTGAERFVAKLHKEERMAVSESFTTRTEGFGDRGLTQGTMICMATVSG